MRKYYFFFFPGVFPFIVEDLGRHKRNEGLGRHYPIQKFATKSWFSCSGNSIDDIMVYM
jgi:hypothetical protein